MTKNRAIFLYFLLLLIGVGTTRAEVASSRETWNVTNAANIVAEAQSQVKSLDLNSPKLKKGVISESSELQKMSSSFRAKSISTRDVNLSDLAGERTAISHRSTGYLQLNSATVTALTNDTVAIANFIYTDLTIKAIVNTASGTFTIPSQKVSTLEQGDIYICKVDLTKNVYSTTDALEGVVENGNLHINDAFGFFITEGEYAGSYLTIGILNYSDIVTTNATITNNVIKFTDNSLTTTNRTVTKSEDWANIYQISEDRIRISHILVNTGSYVDIEGVINSDGTVSFDPQPMYTVSYYGTFCCYPMTETISGTTVSLSAQILSPITATYDTATKTLSIGKWMTASTTVNSYADLYESTSVTTTATITFPNAPTLSFEGEGTEASPYLIKTADDIATLANLCSDASYRGSAKTDAESATYYPVFSGKYFKLANDIDFSSFDKALKPIGTSSYRFAGTFDGAGHTISNFSITDYAYDYLGLFGFIGDDGTVKNIKFVDPYLTTLGYSIAVVAGKSFGVVDSCEVTGGKIYATVGYNASGIVAYNYGIISNSSFTDGYIYALGYIGGIAGRSYNSIKSCSASATLVMTSSEVFVGGIVGYMSVRGSTTTLIDLSDCSYNGTMQAASNEVSLGGIAGMAANVNMDRCFSTAYIYCGYSNAVSLGGLVGSLWQSNINNCYAAGVINGPSTTEVGGLVGSNAEISSCTGSTIKNSYSSAIVLTTNTGTTYGIIGEDELGHTTIENCYYDKQLTPVANETWATTTAALTAAEGITGFDSTIWKYEAGLYPRLAAQADKAVAQLSAAPITFQGEETWKLVKNNFTYSTANGVEWKGVVNSAFSTTGGYAYTFNDGTAELNYKQHTDTIYATKDGMNKIFFVNIAPISLNGEGTAESPWEISTKDDLKLLSTLTNDATLTFDGSYFKMTADIDCEGDTIIPICKDDSGKFTFLGTFDGNGHTISNMVISSVAYYEEGNTSGKPVGEVNPRDDRCYNYGGLFANLGSTGVVKNLTIAENCVYEMFAYGGAIAGGSAGLIENCKNFAPVTVYFSKAGGIVGDLKAGGIVRNCYNAGFVRTDYIQAGGIAGLATSATIENCANAGEVAAYYFNSYRTEGAQNQAGGIAGGATYTTIKNVLNSGKVYSYEEIGGIVGSSTGTAVNPCSIIGAVNYGNVSTLSDATTLGAIIGDNSLTTTDSIYYCKSMVKVGAANNGDLDGIKGLTNAELATDTISLDKSVWTLTAGEYPILSIVADQAQSKLDSKAVLGLAENNFASFITTDATLGNTDEVTWTLKSGEIFKISGDKLTTTIPETGIAADTLTASAFGATRAFPISSFNVDIFDGDGTAASPFLINNADDMLSLSSIVEATGFDYEGYNFQVTADLDFDGKTYVPVAYNGNFFRGTFDGNSKKISNITLTAEDNTIVGRGLFGSIGAGGYVKNLTLDNTNTIQAYSYAGGFAGNLYGTIEGCTNEASVSTTGGSYAGGIAAYACTSSKILSSKNAGKVYSASSYVGGIIGASPANSSVVIDNCSNSDTVYCKTSYAGGIAGYGSVIVTNAVNSGFIQAPTSYAGGIVGYASTYSSITDSHNEGTLNSNRYMGGIVAFAPAHTNDNPLLIENCYNTGAIKHGANSSSGVYAYSGGIGGTLKGGFIVRNCYNTADFAADAVKSTYFGGIIGDGDASANAQSVITNCYNTGSITGDRYLGGIVARMQGDEDALIEFCYNTGDITASNTSSNYMGGIVGTGGYDLTDSYNTGNITGVATYVGGLSGYMTGRDYVYERNFNIGTVTATTSKAAQVGGLIGMGRPLMNDCANYGDVTGYNSVAGLLGKPGNALSSTYNISLNRSYNVGKVTANGGSSATYGNITSKNASCNFLTIDSCYYDTSVSPATPYDEEMSGSGVIGLSHSDMVNIKLGGAFVNGVAIYPLISGYENNEAHSFGIATILLAEGEKVDSVASSFKIGTPYGAVWTCSSNLEISGNDVSLKNTTEVESATLTLTVGELTRTYNLTIQNSAYSGVDGLNNDGKEVQSVKYYTTSGVPVAEPSAEMGVIIERKVYTDGTSATRKYVPKF